MKTSSRLVSSMVVGLALMVSPIIWGTYDNHTIEYPTVKSDTPKEERAPRASRTLSTRARIVRFAYTEYDRRNATAFVEIIWRESRFNPYARNEDSGAYGLGQANPPSKMDVVAEDWKHNVFTQLRWVAKYIEERYGSPVEALRFHDREGWY